MTPEEKKAELDAVAAVRAVEIAAAPRPVTLASLDERLKALESKVFSAPKSEEQSNG